MLLIERLRQRQRHACREAKAPVGFALQAGEVEKQRRKLCRRLGLLGGKTLPALARGDDRGRLARAPDALGLAFGVIVLLETRIEPARIVLAGLGAETRVHFPVIPWRERANLVLALHEDRECRRLHAADRGEVEAALLGIERGHGSRAVDPHQPVGFRAALRRVRQRQ